MPDNPFTDKAREAADRTNQALAGEMAALSIPDATLKKLVPDAGDQEKLKTLLSAVNAATSKNDKIAALQSNIKTAGGALVQLLSAVKLV